MIYHERPTPKYLAGDAAVRWRKNERTLRRCSIALAILVPLTVLSAILAIAAQIIALLLR